MAFLKCIDNFVFALLKCVVGSILAHLRIHSIFSHQNTTDGELCWPLLLWKKSNKKTIWTKMAHLINNVAIRAHIINTLPLNRRKVSFPVKIRELPFSLQQVWAVIENGLFHRLSGKVSCKKVRNILVYFFIGKMLLLEKVCFPFVTLPNPYCIF